MSEDGTYAFRKRHYENGRAAGFIEGLAAALSIIEDAETNCAGDSEAAVQTAVRQINSQIESLQAKARSQTASASATTPGTDDLADQVANLLLQSRGIDPSTFDEPAKSAADEDRIVETAPGHYLFR